MMARRAGIATATAGFTTAAKTPAAVSTKRNSPKRVQSATGGAYCDGEKEETEGRHVRAAADVWTELTAMPTERAYPGAGEPPTAHDHGDCALCDQIEQALRQAHDALREVAHHADDDCGFMGLVKAALANAEGSHD